MANTPYGKQAVLSLVKKTAKTTFIHLDDKTVHCAERHRFMNGDQEIYANEVHPGSLIDTIHGPAKVTSVDKGEVENVYDLEIGHPSHVYYTADGVLHHNTSMCAALSMVLHLNGLQTLVIVPSTDLVAQTVNEFRERLSAYPVSVGEYSGSQKDIDHPIVVATWQSLQNVPHYMGFFSAVIVDEAHGAKAQVIKELINNHGKHISHRYGCTGTYPKPKSDQYSLKLSIGKIVREVPAAWLIEQGYLSEITIEPVETIDEDPELPDYASERAYLTRHEERNVAIAKHIQELRNQYGNTMVLVNTQSLAQGREIAELIDGAVYLDGSHSSDIRQEEYAKYAESDDVIVIASAGIASTGISIDRIFCLVLLDTGKSFVKCIQAVGRGLRKKGDKNKIFVVDLYSKLKYAKKHFRERSKFYKEANYPQTATRKLKY